MPQATPTRPHAEPNHAAPLHVRGQVRGRWRRTLRAEQAGPRTRRLIAAAAWLAGLGGLGAPLPTLAADWLCGLEAAQTRLVCVADPDPETLATEPANGEQTPPVARVRGTSFPLDPSRKWAVDLWTPPTDAAWLYRLAQATICYRSPACHVWLVYRHQVLGPDTLGPGQASAGAVLR